MRSFVFGMIATVSIAGVALAQTPPNPAAQPAPTAPQRDMQVLSIDVGKINDAIQNEVLEGAEKLKDSRKFLADFQIWSNDMTSLLAEKDKQIADLTQSRDNLQKQVTEMQRHPMSQAPSAGPQSHPAMPYGPQSYPARR